jgi:predicted AlkP superfamily pyrophosphatase or phosphodiesterase
VEQAAGRRFLIFAHFSEPDRAGHAAGVASQKYADAIADCDEWLGDIVRRLRTQAVYGLARVYVATDHGFDDGQRSHRSAPRSWLATNDGAVTAGGHLRDVAPTILDRMGVSIDAAVPPYPGRSLAAPAGALVPQSQ